MSAELPKTVFAKPRPATPHVIGLLKTVRSEEAEQGRALVPVTSINAATSPHSPTGSLGAGETGGPKKSLTSPTPLVNDRTSLISEDVKRDSGIAPSTSTATREFYAESHIGKTLRQSGGFARVPSLPTIVVNDDEAPGNTERSRSPFGRKRSKESPSRPDSKSQSPRPSISGVQRMQSFKGIQTDIPSGAFEDLSGDKIGFSHRGSLMFGGKRMFGKSGNDPADSTAGAQQQVASECHHGAGPSSQPAQEGLVSGRRQPSVQMLKAAIQGGRVLSAEETSFSMKVRSMYEHGDENAADWITPSNQRHGSNTPESDRRTPDIGIDSLVVGRTRGGDGHPPRPTTPDPPGSMYKRNVTEVAGGIEDWEDVQGQDVDRYGFINPRGVTSRGSATFQQASDPPQSIQRVATSLRSEANQPRRDRRLRRGLSNVKSTRSLLQKSSRGKDARHAPSSIYSLNSQRSATSIVKPFRSRNRRVTEQASDMLRLPPGLADIAEQEDAGRTANLQRRREWARDEKWQKMARAVRPRERSNSKGGGMQFEFDTSDPKLVNRTWKGIPDRWRATAWHSFLSTSARRRGNFDSDEQLIESFHRLQEMGSADDVQIDVDVPRTISMHVMFRKRYRGGQRLLFRVLHAISLHCPDTGYVQGMASLAATLLCYYDEERAFLMLARLWQLRGLAQLFQSGFDGLMAALNEFEKDWLGGGDVAAKLEELGITSTAYGTRWYLTLFNMSIPFPAQLRVWDVFMLLGDTSPHKPANAFAGADLDVLHATSAALIDATREIILDSDFEGAMKVLTSWVPVKDEDLLMRVALAEWKMRKGRTRAKV